MSALAILGGSMASPLARAMQIERMDVERNGDRFTVRAAMVLKVAEPSAFAAATDYERLPEYNPSILSSRRLGDDRLRSDMRLCAAWFCKTVRQTLTVTEQPPTAIDMQVVPGSGDLKQGSAHWRFLPAGEGHTRLAFEADIQPAFWVPPLVGGYLVARELRRQAEITGRAIERLAADMDAHRPGQAPN
ncbi:SRPBCC family protein [Salinisphaera sp. T31B1]|uniref:SRPBCC family protein n=1 Tax=Salinisphaera sp. T31B1 TaxID=727963 RepID=UPI0033409F13